MAFKVESFWRLILLVALVIVAIALSYTCRRGPTGIAPNGSINQTAGSQPGKSPILAPEDQGDLKLRYQSRNNDAPAKIHPVGSDPKAIENVLGELNQRLILPFDIYLSFEDCEAPDAYYDPEKRQITLCHQIIDEYYELFAIKIKDKTKLDAAVRAAVSSTFFHELGHALVDAWKIPITGREEDAVDQLSTLVLIEATEDGDKMALAGALSFKLYADFAGAEPIYWDEHSLDAQRFFDTICLVYGHDQEKYDYLIKEQTLPEERAALCIEDYERISRSWRQLLAPYLKPATSRPKLNLK